MFKKIVLTVLVLGLMVGVGYAGGVTDDNSGNKGYILVSTGENNGANSVGHWTDSSFLKGEKGDTGATGATGQTGVQGVAGQTGATGATGATGSQGIAGQTGATGSAGQNGLNGTSGSDGQKGDIGSQGEQGRAGVDGENGKTPIKGVDYNDGKDGLNGKDVDPATVEKLEKSIQQNTNATNNLNTRVNKLEETQNIIGGVLRIKDTKKWSVDLFIDYSTNRQMIDRQGIRFTYKMGESYQDKENKRLEARIQALENK